jgi:hypothetical protein
MKGQFFIIASVIIVFTLVGLIRYIYDFGSINLSEIEEMGELNYISYIKKTLNDTAYSSYLVDEDCDKLIMDLDSTINFLENRLKEKGINLEISYQINCFPTGIPPPTISFSYSITTKNLYTSTNFAITIT